jgi:hypothetical protein
MNVPNGTDNSIAVAAAAAASGPVPCDDSPSEQQHPAPATSAQTQNNSVAPAAELSSDNTATSNEDGAVHDKTLSSSPPTTPPPTTDPVDASPVDDNPLATSSSPDRRSDVDEQPIVIAQDFLPSVIAMLESLPPRRVKVYELRRDVWVDLGTGFCQGYIDNVSRHHLV